VQSGAFNDAGDFMVNLLYNFKAQSETELTDEQQAKLTTLRSEIAAGIQQADAGDFVEFSADDILAEARARRSAPVGQ
jgi:Arc/MetJ-type ribon-helix-helix transcriptional regulator